MLVVLSKLNMHVVTNLKSLSVSVIDLCDTIACSISIPLAGIKSGNKKFIPHTVQSRMLNTCALCDFIPCRRLRSS